MTLRRVPARRPVIAPARRAAFEVVRRTSRRTRTPTARSRRRSRGSTTRDRALAQRLAFGTVQRVRTLDFGIEQLGKRPVRKLDPPVEASLRLGAYQLAFTRSGRSTRSSTTRSSSSAPRAASAPCRSRTRSCAGSRSGLRGLVASLPDGPREGVVSRLDRGRVDARLRCGDGARADARAERAAGARGARRPSPVGEPTDVPGAYIVERVDTAPHAADEPGVAARGARRRRARGRARPRRVRRPGRQVDDARGRASVTAVEIHPGRAHGAGEAAPARRSSVVNADVRELDEPRLRPRARRRAVLRARRARPTARPALARAAAAGAAARAARGRGRARRSRAARRLRGLHAERRRERGGRRRARASRSSRSAWSGRSTRIRGGPEFLLTLPHRDRTSGFFIARLRGRRIAAMGWRDWMRTVEVEPSLYAADFARLGDAGRGAARRGRAASSTSTSATGTSSSRSRWGRSSCSRSRRVVTAAGGAVDVHLMVENPAKHFAPIATAGGDSVTFHFEAVDDVGRRSRRRASTGSRSGVAFNPETSPRLSPRSPRRRTSCSAWRSIPGTRASRSRSETFGRVREAAGAAADTTCASRSTAASIATNIARAARRGCDRCSSPGPRSSGGEDPPAAYRRLAQAVAVSLERAVEIARAGRQRAYPKPTVGAVIVRDGETVGEGVTEAGGPPCRGRRTRRGRATRAGRDHVRHARAVRAPRHDAAVRRCDRRGRRRSGSSSARAIRTPRLPAGPTSCAPAASSVECVDDWPEARALRRGVAHVGRARAAVRRSTRPRSRSTAAWRCRASAG